MICHHISVTYCLSPCLSSRILAADSSAVHFGTMWASQMSSAAIRSAFFPAGLKGTRGFAFPRFCWLCADLEWEAEDLSKESEGTPQGMAHIVCHHPPTTKYTPSCICLFACVISCEWLSSFCPEWYRTDDNLSASESCVAVDWGITGITQTQ